MPHVRTLGRGFTGSPYGWPRPVPIQGHTHFITFSCCKRYSYLQTHAANALFEDALKRTRVTASTSTATSSCPSTYLLLSEFDPAKAASNLGKHRVSFREAMTVFYDRSPRPSQTISTPKRKSARSRLAYDSDNFCLLSMANETVAFASSEHDARTQPREKPMKNSKPAPELPVLELDDDLAPRRLDLSKAVRGKYYDRMQAGTNVILLAPDLLDTFPDSEAVNEALRSLKKIAARTSTARPRLRKSATS